MTRTASRLRVVVTGLIAQHPRLGGVAWDYVQYPAGLARLGHDVWYLEDSGEWPYRLDGGADPASWVADGHANVRHLAAVMERAGLGGRWMYRSPLEGRWYGVPDRRRAEILRSADLLVNVSGTLEDPGRYRGIPRLAYIDSDPVFTQARIIEDPAGAFARRVDAHDVTFSFGSRVADGPFATGHRWLPTRQPVVLADWPPAAAAGDALTTVMSWTSYPPVEARGRVLGQKDVELRRLLTLPARSPVPLEIALGSLRHAGWESPGDGASAAGTPAEVLAAAGWRVRDAFAACGTPEAYRAYIRSSRAELSVAKGGYVTGRSGWFSCRSACYLACGRPVVVQDTGFAPSPPAGLGVLAFDSADGALAAIEAVVADPARHARAAREIAAEWFDAGRVLGALVEDALGTGPRAPVGAGA
ncbi:hypothetical protein [Miltoncostaea marina]|uniref:hypothetical protein n=1 Tax=Miltoncostaea marina TaxID=2843215 RepID=UPI001C3E168E|nr:hypothetical protein [Miltoncostaea marina]